jgi:galactose-1-phosphate uridylyltransferase
VKPEYLASFRRGDNFAVFLTFVPMDERQPFEVEIVRGLVTESTRHSIREEAAERFRGFVQRELKSI